jgi:DNA modification methylase
MDTDRIFCADSLALLKTLPDESVNCAVTSPPYFGLRDYGVKGQLGREDTPELYTENLVSVLREVHRVLAVDGTLWLNLADTYCGTGDKGNCTDKKASKARTGQRVSINRTVNGCKRKDMVGIPWLVAFALRADGWYLRNAIIWVKANPMPESVKDRFSRCYEFVFLFAKSRNYYFDAASVAEPATTGVVQPSKGERISRYANSALRREHQGTHRSKEPTRITDKALPLFRNCRDVWHINTVPYRGAHFAAFPPNLAKTCILAGCPEGGVVLDPFFGSGTTGLVARECGRHFIGIDINAEYCRLAKERIAHARGGGGS